MFEGIGAGYTKRPDAAKHKYEKGETIETYRLRNGAKINLPTYYKNQLFTEKERELLFIDKIDKGIIYVLGTRVHRDDEKYYIQLLEEGRKRIERMFGDVPKIELFGRQKNEGWDVWGNEVS